MFPSIVIVIIRLLRTAVTIATGYINQEKISIHNIMIGYNTC